MVVKRQNRFTAGWIEPKAVALNDYESYLAGADEMTNVVCLPEGGFRLRYGLRHLNKEARVLERLTDGVVITAPNGGTAANANDDDPDTLLTTANAIGTTDPYVVVHYDLGQLEPIGFVDIVNASLSVGQSDEFFIQGSADDAVWDNIGAAINLDTTPKTERRRSFNGYRYIRLVRIGATDLGAATVSIGEFHVWRQTGDISNVKMIRYKFNIDQRYLFVITDRNIAVYRNKTHQADLRATAITNNDIPYINWTYGGDRTLICNENFDVQEITRRGTDTDWTVAPWQVKNIPYYDFVPDNSQPNTTLTPSAVSGLVTLTAGAVTFQPGDVNQIIEGNGGRVRITEVTSATVVQGYAEIPFYNTTAIQANNWWLLRGYEPMWSATRGYPRSIAFYQQRTIIGGFRSRPRTVLASVTGDYFNFDTGLFRETDAILRDIDNEEPIVNILPHRALNLFTTGGESALLLPRGIPINQETFQFTPETEMGSEYGLRPVVSNGVIIFIQRGGNSVIQLVYDDQQQAFTATNLSRLASHLIRKPIAFDIRRSTLADEADTLLIVNNDGTLTNGVFINDENVRGFTLTTTNGTIKSVCADEEDVYYIVERYINGSPDLYLEYDDPASLSDASVIIEPVAPTNTFTGLWHLEGETVNVFADGVYLNDQVVVGGQIQTEQDVSDRVNIGLNFVPVVRTLPFEAPEMVGDRMGSMKRVVECRLWFYQSVGCFVNGNEVSFRRFNDQLLDQPLPVYTGNYRVEGLRGWDQYGQVTITQPKPLPLTVLALSLRVNT